MSEHSAGTDLSTTASVNYSLSESSLRQDETSVSLTTSALFTTDGDSDESKITVHMIEKKTTFA